MTDIIVKTIDKLCSILVSTELLFIPAMVLYRLSPHQTLNLVFGTIVGVTFSIVGTKEIFKLIRIWTWFITLNLSIAFIMLIKAMSQ
jgi:hypothetical protein